MKQENEINPNHEYIKKTFEDGSFFQSGKEWFYGKYVSPYKSRFNLIILIILLTFFLIFMLISSIFSILSITAKNGVVSLESDFDDEFIMQKIPKFYNNNEKNILRFIIEDYILYFESYNYDKFSIYKLNEQIAMVKRFSNKSVGDKFERIAKNNYTAEIFGGFIRSAKITSFEFYYPEGNIVEELSHALLPEKTPKKVIIKLISSLYREGGRFLAKEENRQIEITFNHKPLQRDTEGNFRDLEFQVTSYNYIEL